MVSGRRVGHSHIALALFNLEVGLDGGPRFRHLPTGCSGRDLRRCFPLGLRSLDVDLAAQQQFR